MADQYGHAICRSAMARRSVKYPLCLSAKLCVVIFIRSALFWSVCNYFGVNCVLIYLDRVASDDFGTLNHSRHQMPRNLKPFPIPIAAITRKHIAGLNWTNRDFFWSITNIYLYIILRAGATIYASSGFGPRGANKNTIPSQTFNHKINYALLSQLSVVSF